MADTGIFGRFQSAWNAFINRDPTVNTFRPDIGISSSRSNHRTRFSGGNDKSIVAAIYNRCAMDVAAIKIQHCRVDENNSFVESIGSGLNRCLTVEANIDQTNRAFIQDVVMSMFDDGSVALVPVDTSINPLKSGSFDILTLRTGKVLEWFPRHVRVSVYNDRKGDRVEIVLPKSKVAIIENPLYAVMNEPNSTLKRLIRKLNLLDAIDEQSGSGKLDLIIQLPYLIKSEAKRLQADARRKDIEDQLTNSQHGIAYTDGLEKITQLNRPVENNLMGQIEFLTRMLHSQLGLTETIFDGTADEATMLNYFNRTVEPICSAIADELKRKFLTLTAQAQGQSILPFRDPFKLVTTKDLAELSDKFSRNAIVVPNEIRAAVGLRPSKEAIANQLSNKNLNASVTPETNNGPVSKDVKPKDSSSIKRSPK
jgi:hypothetical protein